MEIMRLDGKKVILEMKDCSCTWRGTPGLVAKQVTCPVCNGTARVPENSCDTMPDEMYLALPFKVYRHNRELTYGESLLGWGCVYSCEDYGAAFKSSDEKVLADVRGHGFVQLCKVANKELELVRPCRYIHCS
jgi:hypothetical protein